MDHNATIISFLKVWMRLYLESDDPILTSSKSISNTGLEFLERDQAVRVRSWSASVKARGCTMFEGSSSVCLVASLALKLPALNAVL